MDYHKILSNAWHQSQFATTKGQPGGCARIYVCIADPEHRKGIKAAAKRLGKIYQTNAAYGLRHVLYVGYDNNTGREMAYGKALAEHLTAAGISAYQDDGMD